MPGPIAETPDSIRLFIAIELESDAFAEMRDVVAALDSHRIRGIRTVRPRGVHVTLKFLGDVAVDAVPKVRRAMSEVAMRTSAFDLALGDPGVFPGRRDPRSLWVGIDGDLDLLSVLRNDLEDELAAAGFGRERRRFSPHLTVARVRPRSSQADRAGALRALDDLDYARRPIRVESISLMRTTLHTDGSIYTRAHFERLAGQSPLRSGC